MNFTSKFVSSTLASLGVTVGGMLFATALSAAELAISVTGIKSKKGEIGIALFAEAKGFPMEQSGATVVWLPAQTDGVAHRFTGLPAGRYAVAVSHDLNGNRKTDTNWLGMPQEAWGVSNNVRPKLRSPKFAEAVMMVDDPEPRRITIVISR